jgi:acyl dehydratase
MSLPVVIPGLDALKHWVGTPLGYTDWIAITQERIDRFADATGDRQWIHVDVERARRESPWRQTIAHGYLTLALLPELLGRRIVVLGSATVVNTGAEKLRFAAPVLAGSRVRLHAALESARDVPPDGVRVGFAIRFEIEGQNRPASTARVNFVYYPARRTAP